MTSQISDGELAKLEAAANAGDVSLQYLLGQMYENGLGIPEDPQKADMWYQKAAHAGYALAQINLGWMYAEGRVVDKNDTAAAGWWNMAAAQNNARAQTYLRGTHSPISASDLHDFVKGSMLNSIKDSISVWAFRNLRIAITVFSITGFVVIGGGGLYIFNEITTAAKDTIDKQITQESKIITEMVEEAQETLARIKKMAQAAASSLEEAQQAEAEWEKLLDKRKASEATGPVAVGKRVNVE